jgi:hypothetical protein
LKVAYSGVRFVIQTPETDLSFAWKKASLERRWLAFTHKSSAELIS